MANSIHSFLQYNVVSDSIRVFETQMTFPKIMICLMNVNTSLDLTVPHLKIDKCSFGNANCNADFEAEMMYDVYNMIKRQCYKFNAGRDKLGQLKTIKNQTHINLGLKFDFSISRYTEGDMILIYINDNFAKPIFWSPDQIALPGENLFIILEKTIETKLGRPYNKCIKTNSEDLKAKNENELELKTLGYSETYYRDACVFLCPYIKLSEEKECSVPFLYEKENVSNCSRENILFLDQTEYPKACILEFQIECDTVQYTHNYVKFQDKQLGINRGMISLMFKKFKYTSAKQYPKITLTDLVSKLGGLLGRIIYDIFSFVFSELIIIFVKLKDYSLDLKC